MGRIEAVIPDPLEQRLRIEVVKRFGGKKGGILRAITEALEAWVDTDEEVKMAKTLGKTVRDPKSPTGVKQDAVAALARAGHAGHSLLAEIGADRAVPEAVRSQALKAIEFPHKR